MVRALVLLQVASAAKEAMDVMTYAMYAADDCSGETTGFSYTPLAATEADAQCKEEDAGGSSKNWCINGEMGEQKYSDGACATKSGAATVYAHAKNGACYPGLSQAFAGCGNHQCEYVTENDTPKLVCDHTPAESVYKTTPAPPKDMDASVLDYYESKDCSGKATRMYYPAATKLADADCDADNKRKFYCADGTLKKQMYSDSTCSTKKDGEIDATGECVDGDKMKLIGCGNYKCTQNADGSLDCEYTEPKNTSNSTSGAEMQSGLGMAVLAMAGVLVA